MHKLFISLLVHENEVVILDQLQNFRRFAPDAQIIVHLSKGFKTTKQFISDAHVLGNVHFNPDRVSTNPLNLLCPHLSNLRYIFKLGATEEDFIGFHASNDLLIRHGLEKSLQRYDVGYFSDGYLSIDEKNDPYYALQVYDDIPFISLLKSLGCKSLMKSQIEGLYAKKKYLCLVLNLIESANFDMSAKRGYFAEEVMLPTLLHHVIVGQHLRVGLPYIFSELSLNKKYLELRHRILGYNIFARILGRALKIVGPSRITKGLVDRIRSGRLGIYRIYQKSSGVHRVSEDQVFGVKRVERDINDPLRAYISTLD